jgi:spore coat polysaccharide biosynthesis protein SpsF
MVSNGKVNGYKIVPTATVIIQARMGSKRLPGKTMKKICSKSILEHVIERAKAIEGVSKVVVATCNEKVNQQIIELAAKMKVHSFVGSEDNVLERFYQVQQKFGGEFVVRITADNPFTDVDYASMAVEIATESGADLSSIQNLPLGTAVEVIRSGALEEAYNMSSTAYHFEHVTPYIKEHPELFSIQRHPIKLKNSFKDLRLTVDTAEDLKLAEKIFKECYKGEPFSVQDAIDFLEKNPKLLSLNKNVKQRSMTHAEANSK